MRVEQPAYKAHGTITPSWIFAGVNCISSITADAAVLVNKVWRYWRNLSYSEHCGFFFFFKRHATRAGSQLLVDLCVGGCQKPGNQLRSVPSSVLQPILPKSTTPIIQAVCCKEVQAEHILILRKSMAEFHWPSEKAQKYLLKKINMHALREMISCQSRVGQRSIWCMDSTATSGHRVLYRRLYAAFCMYQAVSFNLQPLICFFFKDCSFK